MDRGELVNTARRKGTPWCTATTALSVSRVDVFWKEGTRNAYSEVTVALQTLLNENFIIAISVDVDSHGDRHEGRVRVGGWGVGGR